MIVSKTVKVRIHGQNLKHYRDFGYAAESGIEIEVSVEHLTKKSTALVLTKCDSCGKERYRKFYRYRSVCNSCNGKLTKQKFCGVKHPHYKDGRTMLKKRCSVCGADGVRHNCNRCKECMRKAKEEKLRKVFCIDCGTEIKSKKAKRCRYCCNNGLNNPAYNKNLTDEQRQEKQKYFIGLDVWRRRVFERDRFTCKKCGIVGELHNGKLHAHHIRNFDDFVEGRLDVENGVTFCECCHKEFHKRFGKKGNSVEQLNEFFE